MSMTPNANGEGSSKGAKRGRENGGKYTQYTQEQIEVLEKVYGECPSPNFSQRAMILLEQPNLKGLDDKQLKIWFQNRRCREKQEKKTVELLEVQTKLTEANNVLREENANLQIMVAELHYDNEYMRNQFFIINSIVISTATANTTTATTADPGLAPEAQSPQMPTMIAANQGLLSLAEEARNEFLFKASGTSINWITSLTLKLPSSVGAIYVPETCIGVAARAYTIIPFEPIQIFEILKDRPSWSRNCRNRDVLAQYPLDNGDTMELIYAQYYAPTTMVSARDFWTLRYTSVLDDGSFLVCEKSIPGSNATSSPAALEFVRGRMLGSGYLIRRCEGGSLLTLVEHLDFEASSVPEVIRPLYESSELVAKKLSSGIRYIVNMASEKNDQNDKGKNACGEVPASLRPFSQKLSRGFNDAINGFTEDGWEVMNADAADNVIMSFKRIQNFGDNANYDSVICVKASLLLQNVIPAKLLKLLKERRSSWMDFNFVDHSAAFSEAATFPFPGTNTHNLSEAAVLLGCTNYEDEVLEVIRFNRVAPHRQSVSSGDLYHLQISNGMDEETGLGACSELIFAPIHRTLPDDAVLLCSGFRVLMLGSNTSDGQGNWSSSSSASIASNVSSPSSMVIMAFQFPFEAHLQENVALMAQKYIQHVISAVKIISLEIMLAGLHPAVNSTEANPILVHASTSGSSFTAMNSTEGSSAMGLAITPDSVYAAMNSAEGNPGMGPAITTGSIFAAMNFTEGSSSMGPAIIQDATYAAMNFTEGSSAMGPAITQYATYAEMNFTEGSSAMGAGITQDATYAAMNFTEGSSAMGSAITQDATYAAMDFTEGNSAMVAAITQDATYAAMDFTEGSSAMGPAITQDATYAAIHPAEANTSMGTAVTPDSTYDVTLANLLRESYRSNLGMEMLGFNSQSNYSSVELIKHHPYAIVCFSFSSVPVCLYANQAGLCMLETTVDNLLSYTVDKIITGSNYDSLFSLLPTIMEQGYAIFPPGFCVSEINNCVSYEQAVVWKVVGPDGSVICLAFAFDNWSFV